MAALPLVRLGKTSELGLPTTSSVEAGTESAASTAGDNVVVPASSVEPVPAACRCDEPAAALAGPPAVLMMTIVAMAATTRPTGIRAASMGCRERRVVGGGGAEPDCRRRASVADAAPSCLGVVLRADADAFLLVVFDAFLGAGRVTRDDPVGYFGIGVLLIWPRRRRAHALGSSMWGPYDGLP